MAAILGHMQTPIETLCERASAEAGVVVAANYNTDEQTVVSGEVAGVERAMALAKEAGAKRSMPLTVSGAFHSPLMAPAEPAFAEAIADAQMTDPNFPVYSNVTALPSTSARMARDLLLRQLTAPVRWVELYSEHRRRSHPGALYVELGPGRNVLSHLVSRIIPERTRSPVAPQRTSTPSCTNWPQSMHIDLSNRVALVTGSTRGIGRTIAQTLAACGAKVAAVVGRRSRRRAWPLPKTLAAPPKAARG